MNRKELEEVIRSIVKRTDNIREVAFRIYQLMESLEGRERDEVYNLLLELCEEGVISRSTYDRLCDYLVKFEICDEFGFDKSIVNTEDDITSLCGLLEDLRDEESAVELVREERDEIFAPYDCP